MPGDAQHRGGKGGGGNSGGTPQGILPVVVPTPGGSSAITAAGGGRLLWKILILLLLWFLTALPLFYFFTARQDTSGNTLTTSQTGGPTMLPPPSDHTHTHTHDTLHPTVPPSTPSPLTATDDADKEYGEHEHGHHTHSSTVPANHTHGKEDLVTRPIPIQNFNFTTLPTKVPLAVGIATVKRGSTNHPQSTLLQTLRSLLSKIKPEHEADVKVFAFNLQVPRSDHDQWEAAKVEFSAQAERGVVTFVDPNIEYGDLLNPTTINRTHGDTIERVLWRSKENLDFAYIYEYCSYYGAYVLFLEDDVAASERFVPRIIQKVNSPPLSEDDWAFYSLYTPHPNQNNLRDRKSVV